MSLFKKNHNKIYYSDFDINFMEGWDKDIAKKTNERAVSQALVNIVTTQKGSMPFDPDYGTTLGTELFANITPFMLTTMVDDITRAIRRYEPRVDQLKVELLPSQFNKNTLEVTITFSTIFENLNLNTLKFELDGSNTYV